MSAPIVFIHFNNSYYLKYTLYAARCFNPDKRVILLGDKTNAHFRRKGIEHHFFEDYSTGKEVQLFDRFFQFITAGYYLNAYKTRFFFRRWFLMYHFLQSQGIDRFWTFDSDTLILTALSKQEHKFSDYDCTEQCGGHCMNGFINNIDVVKGYRDKMITLFQSDDYLDQQRQIIKADPRLRVFSEMNVYNTYKEEDNFRSIALNTFIDGETFDDCISLPHNMKMHPQRIRGKKHVKQLYGNPSVDLFFYHLPTKKFIKTNTLNMSVRMPAFLYQRILKHTLKRQKRPVPPLPRTPPSHR